MADCGCLPEEQGRLQPFEIDATLTLDLSAAADTDDLAHTVDYGALCDRLVALAAGAHVDLMEAMAGRLAAAVLEDERVQAVTVEVRKLRPPVPHDLRTAGVRVTRSR